MARVEIMIGAFLAAWGFGFFRGSTALPPTLLSYGHIPFLIQKLASTTFLFLGLGLMARALILGDGHKKFILKRPLNLMAVAVLLLLFFLLLPQAAPLVPIALVFSVLTLLGASGEARNGVAPPLILALMVWTACGLAGKIPFPR